MAKRKPPVPATRPSKKTPTRSNPVKSSSRATVSGPSVKARAAKAVANDDLALKAAATAELATAFPYNTAKPAEFDPKLATRPPQGQTQAPSFAGALASTLTELNASPKVGDGTPPSGVNPN